MWIGTIEFIAVFKNFEITDTATVDPPSAVLNGVIRSSTPITDGIMNFIILAADNFSFFTVIFYLWINLRIKQNYVKALFLQAIV